MEIVRAKKHLGQHFLKDLNIAKKIADTLSLKGYQKVLEIGPGMGVLTQFLLEKETEVYVIEIDKESVVYLEKNFEKLHRRIIPADFLKFDVISFFKQEPFAIIGNFPYNISSQIVFKVLELRDYIPEFSGMFQKEVAERICEKEGSKTYGILSVLVQAFYEAEYLFTVSENVFNPPPKVKSGVISLIRNPKEGLAGNEKLFKQIVKAGFNQRRKKLSNALKILGIPEPILSHHFLNLRAEELSVDDFIQFSQEWQESLTQH